MNICRLDKNVLADRERVLRDTETELSGVRREVEREGSARCNVTAELRRAQDELSSAHNELRRTKLDHDQRAREADDLRRQLQEYVHEVRRAEEMLGEKECERKQLLEQFCSLSHEATQLESTNHTLERGACEVRAQLGDAIEQTSELRCKLDAARTLCGEYEQQIERLTQRVAQLECQRVCSQRVDQLEQLLAHARQQNLEARVRDEEREREIRRLRCLCERLSGGGGACPLPAPGSGSDGGAGESVGNVTPVLAPPQPQTLAVESKPPVPARRDTGVSVCAMAPVSAPALSLYTANFAVNNQEAASCGQHHRVRTPSPPPHSNNTTPNVTPRQLRNSY